MSDEEVNNNVEKLDEEVKNDVEKNNEDVNEDNVEEEILDGEVSSKLAFANAEIVRLIKRNLPKNRKIKKKVKLAMNHFLEDIVIEVCKKLAKEPYSYIEIDMFERAVKPYKDLKTIEVEKKRLIANLNKIKSDCDVMAEDIERKFSIFDEKNEEEYY